MKEVSKRSSGWWVKECEEEKKENKKRIKGMEKRWNEIGTGIS